MNPIEVLIKVLEFSFICTNIDKFCLCLEEVFQSFFFINYRVVGHKLVGIQTKLVKKKLLMDDNSLYVYAMLLQRL